RGRQGEEGPGEFVRVSHIMRVAPEICADDDVRGRMRAEVFDDGPARLQQLRGRGGIEYSYGSPAEIAEPCGDEVVFRHDLTHLRSAHDQYVRSISQPSRRQSVSDSQAIPSQHPGRYPSVGSPDWSDGDDDHQDRHQG